MGGNESIFRESVAAQEYDYIMNHFKEVGLQQDKFFGQIKKYESEEGIQVSMKEMSFKDREQLQKNF